MIEIIFLRHGLVYNPRKIIYGALPGFGLDETGFAAIDETATQLATYPITAIYSSPLQRAVETVAQIQQQDALKSVPVHTDERLSEWVAVSEGLTYPELESRYPEFFAQYKIDPTKLPAEIDGKRYETFIELEQRMGECIDELRARHDGQTIVVVSHGDPIIMAMAHYLGQSFWETKETQYPRVAQTRTLHFADDSVTVSEWPK